MDEKIDTYLRKMNHCCLLSPYNTVLVSFAPCSETSRVFLFILALFPLFPWFAFFFSENTLKFINMPDKKVNFLIYI